ncbi:MAG TPA: type II secretion system protein GspM, partial [Xanthomonadales bacterium]|nr:type II secretion system protein GspM [Xanthomonadales bacterium]
MAVDAKPSNSRALAVGLLVLAVLFVYLVTVHWWFAAPHVAIAEEMASLREDELRYRRAAAERPSIEKRLAEVRAFESNNPAFLPEADFEAASAGLIQRINTAVKEHAKDDQSCQLIMSQPSKGNEKELYERVTLKVRMRCTLEEFVPVLHQLESGSPMLFVDDVQIWKQQGFRPNNANETYSFLDIRFDLYGYVRKPGRQDES